MPEPTISGRALAAALGVSEKAVRKAVEAGRIAKETDGKFDLAACRSAWDRTTDPARSKVRTSADPAQGPQSAGPQVRTPKSAPLPQADLGSLWAVVTGLPALAAWGIALNGGGLQLAFDIAADLALDIGGDLAIRGFAPPPIPFEPIGWPSLAEEAGLAPIHPDALAADWQRRRDEP